MCLWWEEEKEQGLPVHHFVATLYFSSNAMVDNAFVIWRLLQLLQRSLIPFYLPLKELGPNMLGCGIELTYALSWIMFLTKSKNGLLKDHILLWKFFESPNHIFLTLFAKWVPEKHILVDFLGQMYLLYGGCFEQNIMHQKHIDHHMKVYIEKEFRMVSHPLATLTESDLWDKPPWVHVLPKIE